MPLQPGDLVLCSGTLPHGVPFSERLAAARGGGFAGISLWGRDYWDARDAGLGDRDLVSMLHDHGLSVAEIDPVWSWLPGARDVHIPPALDEDRVFEFGESDLFAIAETLGARSINAVDVFGGDWTLEEATASFSSLCRRAADHGLLVHLEFLPWSKIPDLSTAWEIVLGAGEVNGGIALDTWHYFRGSPDHDLLRSLPADRILAVQLSDAPQEPEANLVRATLHDRLLPGDGELDLGTFVANLPDAGVRCPIGVEVFSDSLHSLPPQRAARMAGDSARRVLGTIRRSER
jgi:sugar phosphate isomerase/epimerase